nr:dipeptidase [uncultured Romboutsia sp.]
MIFDAHCDIWTHVARKRLEGEQDIIRNYHLSKFKESDIIGGIFVVWVDPPYDKNPKDRTKQILCKIKEEIKDSNDIVHIVKRSEDFDIAKESNKIAILIGMEGLQVIDDNIDNIEKLYSFGVRHASLTWNEENKLATGAKGNIDRGLTEDGAKLVKKMEELGMILDVSHANEKTFWDICKVATKPFIASHSNCRSLCDVPRNLTDNQLREIAIRNGVVGINSYEEFVSSDLEKRTVKHLVDHIDHMVKVMGINHIGLGFDFAEYLNSDTLNHYASTYTYGVRGLEDTTKAKNIINVLENRGYSKEDIKKICYKNFHRVIKEIIK